MKRSSNKVRAAAIAPGNSVDGPGQSEQRLSPVLGLFSALAIVVGGVIGSGIYLKPALVAREMGGHVGLVLALWIVCGLINLCGALTLAELAAMMPRAGGTYLFLREAYGRACAFVWSWAEFWVIRSGAIAALAIGITMSLRPLLDSWDIQYANEQWAAIEKSVAVAVIGLLAAINIAGTRWGGATQNVTTVIKVLFMVFLAALPWVATGDRAIQLDTLWPEKLDQSLFAGIAASLSAIMWAYDGWGNLTVVAEEIKDPQRNIPRSLAGGLLLLIVLYVGVNLAYYLTLSSGQIAASVVPAVDVIKTLFGNFAHGGEDLSDFGARLMLSMLMVSVFGALNQNILTGPRVLFAVARDYPVLRPLQRIYSRTQTPAIAIAALCGWSIMLVLLLGGVSQTPGKRLFDVLTDYCIFGGSIFYLLAVVAVFVFRAKRPDAERPYRTWGYPLVPAIFVVFYIALLAGMLWKAFWASLAGLTLIGIGLVVYLLVAPRQPTGSAK